MKIGEPGLTLREIVNVARGEEVTESSNELCITEEKRRSLLLTRQSIVREWLNDTARPIYGFTTGLGRLHDTRIPVSEIRSFQSAILNSHAAGTGDPFRKEIVRASLLLRAHVLALGFSGIRPELIDRLLSFVNHRIHPLVPCKGSVGASGDLAPLAYIGAAIQGHPAVWAEHMGEILPVQEALSKTGLPRTFEFEAKEALAIVNGTSVSVAIAVLALHDAIKCAQTADIALALTVEGLRSTNECFDERIHRARGQKGQLEVASHVRNLLRKQFVSKVDDGEVMPVLPVAGPTQEPYSIRCAPQVHGPVRDALRYAEEVISIEINSASDNPLVFAVSHDHYDVLSGGNFHGQYVAQVMDLLALALTDIGSISERRISRLLDPSLNNGLPRNLAPGEAGPNTGYSILHSTASALVMENRTLCQPASSDSIPTKSDQEDHVSNSTWCARKLEEILRNVETIIAIECLVAAQAIDARADFSGKHDLGRGTSAARAAIRQEVPYAQSKDRWIDADLRKVEQLVRCGEILNAADSAISDS